MGTTSKTSTTTVTSSSTTSSTLTSSTTTSSPSYCKWCTSSWQCQMWETCRTCFSCMDMATLGAGNVSLDETDIAANSSLSLHTTNSFESTTAFDYVPNSSD